MAADDRGARTRLGVALKWVDLRPDVDPLTGVVHDDARSFGCSEADRAALEWALRLGHAWDAEVVAVVAGPSAADALLREALAVGATRAVRVDLPHGTPSEDVAVALADVVRGAALVCCGDYSPDRGSGSVPAFLAAQLGVSQALGLVAMTATTPGSLTVTRRLDHGRREVLAVTGPAVVSVEGSSAELRRAGLSALIRARDAEIEVRPFTAVAPRRVVAGSHAAYRPRARTMPAPDPHLDVRSRILSLTGALVERTPPRTIVADPSEAAGAILDQLRTWGYLGVTDDAGNVLPAPPMPAEGPTIATLATAPPAPVDDAAEPAIDPGPVPG